MSVWSGSRKSPPLGDRRGRNTHLLAGVYRDANAGALDGVDLRVRAGETVALDGPSGAGKTTLVNLLPRFLEPTAGRVLLDGVPLPDWDLAALRRQFALVSQDVVLFNDSIAANVALGAEVDEPRVRAALAAANLLDFALGLPAGLQTPIGHNGSELSGGQRQRLAIARAVYKDAPILILDEATSHLDSESEALVQRALGNLMRDRTTLVVVHGVVREFRGIPIHVLEVGPQKPLGKLRGGLQYNIQHLPVVLAVISMQGERGQIKDLVKQKPEIPHTHEFCRHSTSPITLPPWTRRQPGTSS